MTTGKTIALTRQTFVGKVMSLFFNMLSRLIALLPRSKRLLISWLQSPSAVILEPTPPACWEPGFQAWAQSTCPELSAQGLVPLWIIPGTGDSGGLPSMGSHRVGHD